MGPHDVVGVHDVAAALGHLLPVLAEDHALVVKLLEGLLARNDADDVKEFVPETGIEEVEDRVLGTADIKIDGQPVVEEFLVREGFVVMGIDVAQVIPAGTGPLGHRVRLALAFPSVRGLVIKPGGGGVLEGRLAAFGRLITIHLGQGDGQLFFRYSVPSSRVARGIGSPQ